MLHRDISAGNILIRVAAKYMGPTRTRKWPEIATTQPELESIGGFLTDFELASFEDLDSDQSQKTPRDPISVRAYTQPIQHFVIDVEASREHRCSWRQRFFWLLWLSRR